MSSSLTRNKKQDKLSTKKNQTPLKKPTVKITTMLYFLRLPKTSLSKVLSFCAPNHHFKNAISTKMHFYSIRFGVLDPLYRNKIYILAIYLSITT